MEDQIKMDGEVKFSVLKYKIKVKGTTRTLRIFLPNLVGLLLKTERYLAYLRKTSKNSNENIRNYMFELYLYSTLSFLIFGDLKDKQGKIKKSLSKVKYRKFNKKTFEEYDIFDVDGNINKEHRFNKFLNGLNLNFDEFKGKEYDSIVELQRKKVDKIIYEDIGPLYVSEKRFKKENSEIMLTIFEYYNTQLKNNQLVDWDYIRNKVLNSKPRFTNEEMEKLESILADAYYVRNKKERIDVERCKDIVKTLKQLLAHRIDKTTISEYKTIFQNHIDELDSLIQDEKYDPALDYIMDEFGYNRDFYHHIARRNEWNFDVIFSKYMMFEILPELKIKLRLSDAEERLYGIMYNVHPMWGNRVAIMHPNLMNYFNFFEFGFDFFIRHWVYDVYLWGNINLPKYLGFYYMLFLETYPIWHEMVKISDRDDKRDKTFNKNKIFLIEEDDSDPMDKKNFDSFSTDRSGYDDKITVRPKKHKKDPHKLSTHHKELEEFDFIDFVKANLEDRDAEILIDYFGKSKLSVKHLTEKYKLSKQQVYRILDKSVFKMSKDEEIQDLYKISPDESDKDEKK